MIRTEREKGVILGEFIVVVPNYANYFPSCRSLIRPRISCFQGTEFKYQMFASMNFRVGARNAAAESQMHLNSEYISHKLECNRRLISHSR